MAARRARSRRPVAPEDLYTLRSIHGGSLSPDGGSFVCAVKSVRKDHQGYDSHLYVVSTRDGSLRQFTYGKRGDAGPIYSPGGRLIAFTAKRGNYPGIHILPADGGEARPLVERDGGFGDLSFSPDGRRILCTFRPNDPAEKPGAAENGAKQRAGRRPQTPAFDPEAAPPKREPPICREIDRLHYRADGTGFVPKAEPQIWIFDIATGEGAQITTGRRGAAHPAFSPDGRWVVFARNVQPDPDRDAEKIDLFIVSARGGKPRLLPTPPGPVGCPRFSPDGARIAYIGHDDVRDPWYEQDRVWVVPANGRGGARCLSRRFDQPAYDTTVTDIVGGPGLLFPHWSPDGRSIFFMSSRHGSTGLYRVPARGGAPQLLTPDRIHLQSACVAADGRTAAGVVSTPTMPPEVFSFDLRAGTARRLTTLNRAWTDEIEVRRPRRVLVRSTEKTRVEGWVLTPPKFNPRRKYPAIVEVHGGPQTQYGYSFFHEMQLLAARGFVVLYSNPRGSQGYGRAFAEAIKADWGNRDFADIMAVTDFLERLPYVNPKRIGITGGSYGGYMTNWAVGHTRRYKAAVTQRSVVDLVPFFGSSDIGFRFHRTLGAYPWEDVEAYRRQSPLTYAQNIRTPLLILHNEGDLRCGIEQAENLFATLKILGRKVEFVRFPGEPHGLSRSGRPDRRVARLEKIVEWFERHL